MIKHPIFRKSSRIIISSALVGTSAALLLIGAPADAATVQASAGSFYDAAVGLFARGI